MRSIFSLLGGISYFQAPRSHSEELAFINKPLTRSLKHISLPHLESTPPQTILALSGQRLGPYVPQEQDPAAYLLLTGPL